MRLCPWFPYEILDLKLIKELLKKGCVMEAVARIRVNKQSEERAVVYVTRHGYKRTARTSAEYGTTDEQPPIIFQQIPAMLVFI